MGLGSVSKLLYGAMIVLIPFRGARKLENQEKGEELKVCTARHVFLPYVTKSNPRYCGSGYSDNRL